MTQEERERYIQVIKDISSGTGMANAALKSDYDDLVTHHSDMFPEGIHYTNQFLAWHRWFILTMEDLLRQVHPCITVPYWAMEKDAIDPWASDLWGETDDWFGSSNNGQCVEKGPFALPWTRPLGQCLTRNFQQDSSFFDLADIQLHILNKSPIDWWEAEWQIDNIHNTVHGAVGGTCLGSRSGEAPEFWLFHTNLDRIWHTWQSQGEDYLMVQSDLAEFDQPMMNKPDRTPRLETARGWSIADVTDLSNQRGTCVQYDLLVGETAAESSTEECEEAVYECISECPDEVLQECTHLHEITTNSAEKGFRLFNPEATDAQVREHFKTSKFNELIQNRKVERTFKRDITKITNEDDRIFCAISGVVLSDLKEKLEAANGRQSSPRLTKALSKITKFKQKIQVARQTCTFKFAKLNEKSGCCPIATCTPPQGKTCKYGKGEPKMIGGKCCREQCIEKQCFECPSTEDICSGKKQCKDGCPCPAIATTDCPGICPSTDDVCSGHAQCKNGCACPTCGEAAQCYEPTGCRCMEATVDGLYHHAFCSDYGNDVTPFCYVNGDCEGKKQSDVDPNYNVVDCACEARPREDVNCFPESGCRCLEATVDGVYHHDYCSNYGNPSWTPFCYVSGHCEGIKQSVADPNYSFVDCTCEPRPRENLGCFPDFGCECIEAIVDGQFHHDYCSDYGNPGYEPFCYVTGQCAGMKQSEVDSGFNFVDCKCPDKDEPEIVGDGHFVVMGRPGSICDLDADCSTRVENDAKLFNMRCCKDAMNGDEHNSWMNRPQSECDNVWATPFIREDYCCGQKSFSEAELVCKSLGARLCTKTEVEDGCAAYSGCHYDFTPIWTATTGKIWTYSSPPTTALPTNMQPTPSGPRYYWVVKRGHESTCKETSEIDEFCGTRRSNVMNNHAITCCSDEQHNDEWHQRNWNNPTCQGVFTESDIWHMHHEITAGERCIIGTWFDAQRICTEAGGRLCTKMEMEQGCAKSTGCEFDGLLNWTSDYQFLVIATTWFTPIKCMETATFQLFYRVLSTATSFRCLCSLPFLLW